MPPTPISVLILYNQPPQPGPGISPEFVESQAGVLDEVRAVADACDALRIAHDCCSVRFFDDVPEVLSGSDHTVVFNLVEGFECNPELASYVPAVAASFGKACTGNETAGLLLTLDKGRSKAILEAAGLPCPKGLVVPAGENIRRAGLFDGPFIVKPVSADASEGIDNAAIVRSKGRKLAAAVAGVHKRLGQDALVEQYIEGRELNVSVIHRNGKPEVLPLAEIDFSAFEPTRPRIVGYDAKWRHDSFEYNNTPRIIPAPLPARLADRIRVLACGACAALDCRDYCRVDFRLDGRNNPYILEVNANPDISPEAGFAAALSAAGISYKQFVRLSIRNAMNRLHSANASRKRISKRAGRSKKTAASMPGVPSIRRAEAADREAVIDSIAKSRLFRPGEIQIAREVFDEAITAGPSGHYQSFVIERDSRPLGWVCWGPTPCTVGTCDLYWIAVAPDVRKQGLGKALIEFAEQHITAAGKSLVIVETSGRPAYEAARAFYTRLGYRLDATIDDFYGPADPKLIFTKALPALADSRTANT
jgi:D-alanine-D-alanine ligase